MTAHKALGLCKQRDDLRLGDHGQVGSGCVSDTTKHVEPFVGPAGSGVNVVGDELLASAQYLHALLVACAVGFCRVGGVEEADAQALRPASALGAVGQQDARRGAHALGGLAEVLAAPG